MIKYYFDKSYIDQIFIISKKKKRGKNKNVKKTSFRDPSHKGTW